MEYSIINERGTITATRYLGGFVPDVPTKFTYERVVETDDGYRLLWGVFEGEENDPLLIESTTFLSSARPKKKQKELLSWLDALTEKMNAINTTFDKVVKRARATMVKPKEEHTESVCQKIAEVVISNNLNNIDLWVISSFI